MTDDHVVGGEPYFYYYYYNICFFFPLVATGFPAGQTPLETRLQEVRLAVADGATEIDIVINRTLALTGQWKGTTCTVPCDPQ